MLLINCLAKTLIIIVGIYNHCKLNLCPMWDKWCNNYKHVLLPVLQDDEVSMKLICLHPNNTKLHYYFQNQSSYDYLKTIKATGEIGPLQTATGDYSIINYDDDYTIKLIL